MNYILAVVACALFGVGALGTTVAYCMWRDRAYCFSKSDWQLIAVLAIGAVAQLGNLYYLFK